MDSWQLCWPGGSEIKLLQQVARLAVAADDEGATGGGAMPCQESGP